MSQETYNPKEAYILHQAARSLRQGELVINKPDFTKVSIYYQGIDGNYEITIKKL